MTIVYIILGLLALCAILGVAVRIQAGRIKAVKTENKNLRGAVSEAAAELERVRKYAEKNRAVEGNADAQRQELGATDDSGLARRANNLFGVRGD